MMKNNTTRRSFLETAAVAGGAVMAGAAAAEEKKEPKKKFVRKTPSVELMQIGVVALKDYSHLPTIWGPTINQVDSGTWPVGRTTGMLITHCWDRKYDVAQDFANKYKCEPVKNYYDMVDKVDAMIFGGFYEVKWWPQLTKPYLEAGIPCHINRPFAFSMKAAKEMVETAKKHNTPILCTDEREYIKESLVAHQKVEQLLKEGKTIVGASGTNSAGNEYPAHGVHGLYFMLETFGVDVKAVSFLSNGWWNEKTKTSVNPMTWGILNLLYSGLDIPGIGKQDSPFIVSQHQKASNSDASVNIHYTGKGGVLEGGNIEIEHHWDGGEPFTRLFYLFFPTVLAMQRMFETRKMQWSYDYILQKTRIFLTGFYSHMKCNGAMVNVNDLPDDWEAPCPYPDWIDESIFS
ncbi:MAG: Gfo/Idh/MocA family oxidoreductase [Candidatus Latescibacterota bacterium]